MDNFDFIFDNFTEADFKKVIAFLQYYTLGIRLRHFT